MLGGCASLSCKCAISNSKLRQRDVYRARLLNLLPPSFRVEHIFSDTLLAVLYCILYKYSCLMTNLAMAIMSECSLFFVFTTVLFTQFPQAAYHIVYFATSGCCMYMPTFILHFCTVRVYVFVIVFLCLFFLSRYVCIHCDVFHFFLCDKNEKHSAHMGFFFFVSYKFLVPFKEGKKCP